MKAKHLSICIFSGYKNADIGSSSVHVVLGTKNYFICDLKGSKQRILCSLLLQHENVLWFATLLAFMSQSIYLQVSLIFTDVKFFGKMFSYFLLLLKGCTFMAIYCF